MLKQIIQSTVFLPLFFLLLASEKVDARTFQYVGVDHFSTDIWQTLFRRDPYQPEYTEKWTQGGQFNFDLRFLQVLKWENGIHVDGTESQLRNAGWEFTVTTDYYYHLRPFYYHHSEHAFDTVGSQKRFPVVDRYGISICWLGCK